MFHRQHKDIIVLAQRTGMKFSNKHTFPLTLRHCHTAATGKSEAAVKSVAASRVNLFFYLHSTTDQELESGKAAIIVFMSTLTRNQVQPSR